MPVANNKRVKVVVSGEEAQAKTGCWVLVVEVARIWQGCLYQRDTVGGVTVVAGLTCSSLAVQIDNHHSKSRYWNILTYYTRNIVDIDLKADQYIGPNESALYICNPSSFRPHAASHRFSTLVLYLR
jgi:hypothetical protein